MLKKYNYEYKYPALSKGDRSAWKVFPGKNLRAANPEKDAALVKLVYDLCERNHIEPPARIIITDSPIMNAAVHPLVSSMAFTQGILDHLNAPQLEAVIGHEMTHFRERGILGAARVGAALITGHIAGKLVGPAINDSYQKQHGKLSPKFNHQLHSAALQAVGLYSGAYAMAKVSQHYEKKADKGSFELTGNPGALREAFEVMQRVSAEDRANGIKHNKSIVAKAMKILFPFRTHPRLQDRIETARQAELAQIAERTTKEPQAVSL